MEDDFKILIEDQIKLLETSVGDQARTSKLSWSTDSGTPSASTDLVIEYCARQLRWLVEFHPKGVDLTPLEIGLAQNDSYGVFTLENMPCMASWTPNNSQGLVEIHATLRSVFTDHQKQLIEKHSNKSVSFNLDAVKHNQGVEGFVSTSDAVHLLFPLFDEASAVDYRLRTVKVLVTFEASHNVAGVAFVVPRSMHLTGSHQAPRWDLSSTLWDYLPPVQLFVQNAWNKRREMVEALAGAFSMLEFDALDYSRAVVAARAPGKSKVIRLVDFTFGMDFPEKPPVLTILEFQGPLSWRLDPLLYRYSPRWSALRQVDELMQHALTANSLAWAPAQQNAGEATNL